MGVIKAMGLDLDGNPMFEPIEDPFLYLTREAPRLHEATEDQDKRVRSGGDVEKKVDWQADASVAGWTIIVNQDDPRKAFYKEVFEPLARLRGLVQGDDKLEDKWIEINNESLKEENWPFWISLEYIAGRSSRERARYVLILGDVDQFPLNRQIDLSLRDFVGRLAFENEADYKTYVDKVIALETNSNRVISNKSLFLAPIHPGPDESPDPTFYSATYLVPEVMRVVQNAGGQVIPLVKDDATKKNFVKAAEEQTPALVFTASHGLPPVANQTIAFNKQYTGAIQFPHKPGVFWPDKVFSGDDVANWPSDKPLFEGSVFFQFACYGYGSPAKTDYSVWNAKYPNPFPGEEYISALPRKLLAHPKGPIAFVGHLDLALIEGMSTPQLLHVQNGAQRDTRLMPFRSSLKDLFNPAPTAYSMWDMKEEYFNNLHLQVNYALLRFQQMQSWNEEQKSAYVSRWLALTDAKNYLVFGDPAAKSTLRP